jgi:hypothetical protein
MGSPNVEHGLHQLNADAASTAVTVFGGSARDCSRSASMTFTVDPNFLSYTRGVIKISAVVRKISATDNPGFNLRYESATGRKGIGWNSVPSSDKWYTLTWTVSDDEFVGDWGYNFSFDCDSTNYSRYYLQQVTITNLTPRPASAPTGFIATPGVGKVALSWNGVPGATSYNVKRAGASGGPYGIIAPILPTTHDTDAGLAVGTPCYYVVSPVNSGGEGPDSTEAAATPIAPSLTVLMDSSAVQFSWPTSAVGFALQEAAIIQGGWTNSSAEVEVQGVENVAVVSTLDRAKFFRLVQ